MRKTNQKGFTIIELLVVIVIIGILVALALPQLFAAQARGRDTDRKNDLKNLQQKLETYFNDNDEYPGREDADAMEDAKITASDFEGPRDSTYEYSCDGADPCQSYTLSVTLENDKDKDAQNGVYQLRSVNQPEGTTEDEEE
jgi:type IV pilus assembly protein PilA